MSEDLRATVRAIKAAGATSLGAIAKALQDRGIKTPAGNTTWHRAQVSRLLDSEPPAPPGEEVPGRIRSAPGRTFGLELRRREPNC